MNTTNTTVLRAALIEARDWFESQAKAVSKGCGSSYELHDLRVQRDALDAALAAPAQPVAWPKDAAEVRDFMNANFMCATYANENGTPSDDDRYQLSAHDFLSAVDWWADFPHHPDLHQPPAQAQEDAPDMFWDADDTENFAHEVQDIVDGYCSGEIVTIECAKRMPNFRVLITGEGDSLSYEHIDAASAAQQGGKA